MPSSHKVFHIHEAGTGSREEKVYWFCKAPMLAEKVPFALVECLDAEEIGQELGGN